MKAGNKGRFRSGWGQIVRHYSINCAVCGLEYSISGVTRPAFTRSMFEAGYIQIEDGIVCPTCFKELEDNEDSEYLKKLEREYSYGFKEDATDGKQENTTDV